MHHCRTHVRAFTLLELAIVLTVLGLLAGGITAGQYLVKQGEVNSIMTEMEKFKSASMQFYSTYSGKPGDITDAESYWGTDGSGCPANTNRNPRAATCNGNGDRRVTGTERWRAWQQLAAAQLIEGNFSGVAGSGGAEHAISEHNVPAGKLRNSAYYMVSFEPGDTNTNYFPTLTDMDAIFFGLQTEDNWPSNAALTPRQTYQIDSKYDDGKPAHGTINSTKNALTPNCTTADTTDAKYNLTYPATACILIYFLNN